jgi:membrane protease YdiL (CAAX protease family)
MTTPIEYQGSSSNILPLSRQIISYLALVFLFSSVPYTLVIHNGHLATGNGLVVFLLMWCPALAALATLGWSWRPARYELWAYLLPLCYSFPVYLATWLFVGSSFAFGAFAAESSAAFGFPHWARTATWLLTLPVYASVGVLGSMTRALGEEIGWRGFLLPRLVRRAGFTRGCFLSGCIWAVWHYPLLLFADYNAGTPRLYAVTCFTLMVIGAAFIFGWFRLKSGSLWPAAMLHASHNLFIQAIFDRITNPAGKSLYVTTEFGAGLALTVGACAFYLWTRRGEVEHLSLQNGDFIERAV